MRIVVSAQGEDLDAPASPVFGRCPTYILIESDTMQFEAIANPAVSQAGGRRLWLHPPCRRSAVRAKPGTGCQWCLTGGAALAYRSSAERLRRHRRATARTVVELAHVAGTALGTDEFHGRHRVTNFRVRLWSMRRRMPHAP